MGQVDSTYNRSDKTNAGERANARPLRVLSLYILLTFVMTFPMILRLGDSLLSTDANALNDTFFSVWIFGWQSHQLAINPLQLFQGNIFYPFANTLAFSEIILPEALFYMPISMATGNPVLAYNVVVLGLFALNGLAMYLWAFEVLAPLNPRVSPRLAAFVAGLIFAFCTYKLGEIRHVQLLAAQWMPLTMMYLARGLRRPSIHNGFLTGLFFALNALSSLYYAVFLAVAMLIYAVVDFAWRRYAITRAHLIYAATGVVLILVLVVPLLLPFFQLESVYHFSAGRDPRLFAARPASYLASLGTSWLYGKATRDFYVLAKGQPLFPGITVLVLAILGTVAGWRLGEGRARQAIRILIVSLWVITLAAVVLSFGPFLMGGRDLNPLTLIRLPYWWLSRVLTPLASLNAPARFAVLVMLALSLLAAFGVQWLAGRFQRGPAVITAVVAALVLLEFASVPLPLTTVAAGDKIPGVYQYLASLEPGQPVVELPMGQPNFASQDRFVEYTYNSVYHWQPLVNGYSTFIPQEYYGLVGDIYNKTPAETVKRLKAWGARLIVLNSDKYPDPQAIHQSFGKLSTVEYLYDDGVHWLYRIK